MLNMLKGSMLDYLDLPYWCLFSLSYHTHCSSYLIIFMRVYTFQISKFSKIFGVVSSLLLMLIVHGPMKDEYRFWPGLLLVARIPVLLTVTFLKNESRVLLLAAAAIILSLSFIFGGVYRKKLNNIIEFWFLLNLCIMASLSIAFTDESEVLIWYNTCLSVFIFSFILIVVCHLYHIWNVMML